MSWILAYIGGVLIGAGSVGYCWWIKREDKMAKMKKEEEERLYAELGELDEQVKDCSKRLAYVYKRRQEIYEKFDW